MCKLRSDMAANCLTTYTRQSRRDNSQRCSKVQKQPFFADLFLEVAAPNGKRGGGGTGGRGRADTASSKDAKGGEFILLSAAMSLLDVENPKVQRKVRECMKICLCLPSSSVAATVTEGGSACTEIARRLLQLYAEMPQEFEDDDILNYVNEWTVSRKPNWQGTVCVQCNNRFLIIVIVIVIMIIIYIILFIIHIYISIYS